MSNDTLPDLPDDIDEMPEEQRERFRVNDDSAAVWAMRKLAAIQAKQRELTRIADREVQRITEWIEAETKPLERRAAFFEGLLVDYGRRQRMDEGRKSINLPHGKITTRAGADKWHIAADQTLEWLKANGMESLIRVKEEPALSLIKDAMQVSEGRAIAPTGEVVPGIVIESVAMTVSVSVNSDINPEDIIQ